MADEEDIQMGRCQVGTCTASLVFESPERF